MLETPLALLISNI